MARRSREVTSDYIVLDTGPGRPKRTCRRETDRNISASIRSLNSNENGMHFDGKLGPKLVERYNFPIPTPEWSQTGDYILPSQQFGVLPGSSEKAELHRLFRERFSCDSIEIVPCVCCFRIGTKYSSSSMSWTDYLIRYGEFIKCPEQLKEYMPPAPAWLLGTRSTRDRDAYGDLMVNWDAVRQLRQSGTDAVVTLCSTCSDHRGVGNAPKFAAVNGTWVGQVPECLKDLTLAEEILIGRVYIRGLVLYLTGPGARSHWQRGFTGHVISFPLHTASTLCALQKLPLGASTFSETISVVYYKKASGRDELIKRYGGALKQLVYVRRHKVREALMWLQANNPLYSDIIIDEANLDTLPECGVPETVWSSFICDDREAPTSAEREHMPQAPRSPPSAAGGVSTANPSRRPYSVRVSGVRVSDVSDDDSVSETLTDDDSDSGADGNVSVTLSDCDDGLVTDDGSVVAGSLVDGYGSVVAGSVVPGSLVAGGSVVDGSLVDGSVMAGSLVDGSVVAGSLVAGGSVVDGSVVDGSLVAGSLVAGSLMAGGSVEDGSLVADGDYSCGGSFGASLAGGVDSGGDDSDSASERDGDDFDVAYKLAVHDLREIAYLDTPGNPDSDAPIDLGIISTGIVDTNGTGVAARYVRKKTLESIFKLKVGVGNQPVSEFANCGELLAKAFPVLFPYGVGAPGSLSHREPGSTGPTISLADHSKFLMEHSDSRFAGHKLFPFTLLNMLQRHAACRAAKAIVHHRDVDAVRAGASMLDDEDLRIAIARLDSGCPMDDVYRGLPDAVRRVLSKINIVGHTVPGSPHARRKLLPQLYGMVYTLGPPTLFITINPNDFSSPVLMQWATGKGDLDLHEPLRGVRLERLKEVADHPALAARYFNEMCVAFQDIILGAANGGFGIFGKTAGYYGVTETQGRGTLHCHYVVWLEGAGTSDGIQEAIRRDENGDFRRKLINFFDSIVTASFTPAADGGATDTLSQRGTGDPEPTECMPPHLGIPYDETECERFESELRQDAELVARQSNMHKESHTFTCFKGKKVCRFGFPKELVGETRYDDEHGIVGKRDDEWLNSFNVFMASTLRCNHDIKLLQSTVDCRGTIIYVASYITKCELTTHTLLPVVRASLSTIRKRADEAAVSDNASPPVDYAVRLVQRTLINLIGNQETSAPQACQLLMQLPMAYKSHDFQFVPFGAARGYLLRQGRNDGGVPSDTDSASESDTEESDSADDGDEGEPTISLVLESVNPGGTSLSTTSLLNDYINRPVDDEWSTVTLLEYCLTARKEKKRPEDDLPAQPANRSSPGRRRAKRSLFPDSHKDAATHVLKRVSVSDERLPIPQLGGGSIPKRNLNDEMYCLSVLLLALPWRSVRCLKLPDESWCDAYMRQIGTDLASKVDKRLFNMLSNIEAMHKLGECRNMDLRMRDERERQQLLLQGRVRRRQQPEDYATDVAGLINLTNNYDPSLLNASEQAQESDVESAVNALGSACDPVPAVQDVATLDDDGIAAAPSDFQSLLTQSEAAIKALRRNVHAPKEPERSPISGSARQGGSDLTDETPEQYANRSNLNTEQRACFLSFIRHAEQSIGGLGGSGGPPPDMWILTGEGGSGKTHTIQCIVDYFALRQWSHHLRVSATTGAAASNLNRHASTIDSLVGLGYGSNANDPVSDGFATAFADVYYLIIDEYSMLSCEKLYAICAKLKQKQGPTEHPSGKVSILFAGDPHQFQPVKGFALTKYYDSVLTGESRSVPTERDLHIAHAGITWLRIKNVVVLKSNYRQAQCTVLRDMLRTMRSGQLSPADCRILDQRVISPTRPIDPELLSSTQFIVQRNAVRLHLNNKLDVVDCAARGKTGVLVVSDDVITATQEPPTPEVQRWIDLHSKPSHVRQLQRRTLYYVGQSIRFTHNLCPEYGVANGSLGEIVAICLDPVDRDLDPDHQGHLHPTRIPAYMLVKIPDSAIQIDDNLGPGVIPVRPVTVQGKLSVTPANSTENINIRYARTAFPLIPTRCITDYKSQGSGFTNTVLDLRYPEPRGRGDYGLAVYVMLSRARELSGLRILRSFDHHKLQVPFPAYVRREWNRMQALSDAFVDSML